MSFVDQYGPWAVVTGAAAGVGDRWDQALVLTRIAAECFTAAAETNGSSGQAA